jgi:hypothetical protein
MGIALVYHPVTYLYCHFSKCKTDSCTLRVIKRNSKPTFLRNLNILTSLFQLQHM